MTTIDVLSAAGLTVAIEKPLPPGRAAAVASRPVAICNEDLLALAQLHADLATTLAGYVDGLETLIGTSNANLSTLHTDLATTIAGYVDGLETLNGPVNEAAPATDTASSGLNGRLQRIAQRLAAGAANIAKAEDAASADADVGVPAMAIRKAAPANTSGTDGDYEMLQMSAGRLWISALLEAGSAIIGKVGIDQTAGQNLVKPVRSATGTKSNVAGSAASVTVLASNANRLGATIWNDSTATLYLDLGGGAATATSCTVKLVADAFYEVPFNYTGAITGIWASAVGAARVTEFT